MDLQGQHSHNILQITSHHRWLDNVQHFFFGYSNHSMGNHVVGNHDILSKDLKQKKLKQMLIKLNLGF
jgi:hypothetical protein